MIYSTHKKLLKAGVDSIFFTIQLFCASLCLGHYNTKHKCIVEKNSWEMYSTTSSITSPVSSLHFHEELLKPVPIYLVVSVVYMWNVPYIMYTNSMAKVVVELWCFEHIKGFRVRGAGLEVSDRCHKPKHWLSRPNYIYQPFEQSALLFSHLLHSRKTVSVLSFSSFLYLCFHCQFLINCLNSLSHLNWYISSLPKLSPGWPGWK